MKRPTETDIRAFLEEQGEVQSTASGTDWCVPSLNGGTRWYPEPQALLLAELCLLTGQPLTDINTVAAQLDLAGRMADLEEAVAKLVKPPRRSTVPRQAATP